MSHWSYLRPSLETIQVLNQAAIEVIISGYLWGYQVNRGLFPHFPHTRGYPHFIIRAVTFYSTLKY